ncbi:hypothetical protein NKG94_20985 [Micromonospora sp. M12]
MTASQTTGAHHRPDVAASASGEALVVWDEDADANGSYNIGLTRLARSNGAVALSRRTANAQSGGQQQRASVAANFAGDFTVGWESDHTGTRGVWSRSFTATGTARHDEVPVSTGTGAVAPGSASTTRTTSWWAGRCPAPTRTSGRVASTRTARPPDGWRPRC